VLEALTDPSVPPLPPHITIEQAKQLATALTAGEPRAWDVIKRSFAGKAKEFVVRG
jgi:pyruvate dehydrogenase (quinone)